MSNAGWVLFTPSTGAKKTTIKVRLCVPEKRGKPQLQFSIPSAVAGMLGFEAKEIEACHVYLGSGENLGRVWIKPAADGGTKLKRLKHCVMVAFPPPPGLPLRDETEEVQYERPDQSETGVVFKLPAWATPGGAGEVAPSTIARDKPAGLEINGTTIVLGGREARLTRSQMAVVEKLNERFGSCVSKQAIHEHLYAIDPNGGAEEKIVDVLVSKIRAHLHGWPIAIVTHWGKGYELRRAVT